MYRMIDKVLIVNVELIEYMMICKYVCVTHNILIQNIFKVFHFLEEQILEMNKNTNKRNNQPM